MVAFGDVSGKSPEKDHGEKKKSDPGKEKTVGNIAQKEQNKIKCRQCKGKLVCSVTSHHHPSKPIHMLFAPLPFFVHYIEKGMSLCNRSVVFLCPICKFVMPKDHFLPDVSQTTLQRKNS